MYVCMYVYIYIYIYIYIIYIYIYHISFYPNGCTLTTASRYKINVTHISQKHFLSQTDAVVREHVSSNLQVSTFDSRLNFTRRVPFRG